MENCGSHNALPFITINLGAEMMYIVDQRLKAQHIQEDRSRRVLVDVIRTLFSEKFIEEIMRPQEVYSLNSTKKIFEKIAHSSIMRLNAASMSKLFDLMVMGVKYQIMCCKFPEEVLQVTCTHLRGLSALIPGAPENTLISWIEEKIRKKYEKYSCYEFERLRQTLLKFFQGRHVKVSLFIQEGMQNLSGTILFPKSTNQAPGVKKPGVVTYSYYEALNNRIYDKTGALSRCKNFHLLSAEDFVENTEENRIGIKTTNLGINLYSLEKGKDDKSPSSTMDGDPSGEKSKDGYKFKGNPLEDPGIKVEAEVVKNEMNLLANALRSTHVSESETFNFNPFPTDPKPFAGGSTGHVDGEEIIVIDRKYTGAKKLLKEFEVATDFVNKPQEKQDLMDLMDEFDIGNK